MTNIAKGTTDPRVECFHKNNCLGDNTSSYSNHYQNSHPKYFPNASLKSGLNLSFRILTMIRLFIIKQTSALKSGEKLQLQNIEQILVSSISCRKSLLELTNIAKDG